MIKKTLKYHWNIIGRNLVFYILHHVTTQNVKHDRFTIGKLVNGHLSLFNSLELLQTSQWNFELGLINSINGCVQKICAWITCAKPRWYKIDLCRMVMVMRNGHVTKLIIQTTSSRLWRDVYVFCWLCDFGNALFHILCDLRAVCGQRYDDQCDCAWIRSIMVWMQKQRWLESE